jgi:hypothetical protein
MYLLPMVESEPSFDTARDFVPVSLLARFEFGVVAGPAVGAKDFKQFVAWLKANSAKATYGVPSSGTIPHFTGSRLFTASRGRAKSTSNMSLIRPGGAENRIMRSDLIVEPHRFHIIGCPDMVGASQPRHRHNRFAPIRLMLVGVALSAMIWRLQAYLLRWQRHNMVE